jgi:hypothetical protein
MTIDTALSLLEKEGLLGAAGSFLGLHRRWPAFQAAQSIGCVYPLEPPPGGEPHRALGQ